MDELYGNIGGKLKGLATTIFLVEAVIAIIAGLCMMIASQGNMVMLFCGPVVMVLGTLVAFVSSWLLYAFGELVEKTVQNESNTRTMMEIMKQQNGKATSFAQPVRDAQAVANAVSKEEPTMRAKSEPLHRWRCNNCGNMRNGTMKPCEHCGAK